MSNDKLASTIDDAFEVRDKIGPKTKGAVRKAVNAALELLDSGRARVAERKADGHWQVNQWLKKAVLLSFRLNDLSVIPGGPGKGAWWDKVESKFKGWNAARFRKAGFRAVPGCVVRRSAFIAPGVVLMPSFVNLGAYVDSGTMIDTWATAGKLSLAQNIGIASAPARSARTPSSSAISSVAPNMPHPSASANRLVPGWAVGAEPLASMVIRSSVFIVYSVLLLPALSSRGARPP